MVEGDPDDETYYELGKQSTSNVPVRVKSTMLFMHEHNMFCSTGEVPCGVL